MGVGVEGQGEGQGEGCRSVGRERMRMGRERMRHLGKSEILGNGNDYLSITCALLECTQVMQPSTRTLFQVALMASTLTIAPALSRPWCRASHA